MRRYILSGGPGSGKSSLLQTLLDRGYACSPEVSRQVIMEELAQPSGCLPWINLPCFAEKVLSRMTEAYRTMAAGSRSLAIAPGADTAFFDRGIPDIIAYLLVAGLPVPAHFYRAAEQHPYEPLVFLLPPWPDIYIQDPARWQTYLESERIYLEIKATYQAAGYRIAEVPRAPLAERADYILHTLNLTTTQRPCAIPAY